MRLESAAAGADDAEARATAPNFVAAGRYAFTLSRTDKGWRIRTVTVHEKWRSTGNLFPSG
jgi:hypothetical protein